jgi:magnesium-transporting ATPase (P-type)
MISKEKLKSTPWHHLNVKTVVKELNTDIEKGLTSEQAAERLEQFGLNRITPKKGKSPLMRF